MEKVGDIRKIRVQFHPWHNPPIWASYYEPPGRPACCCHASSLSEMMDKLREYFTGKPLRIEERFRSVLR